MAKKRSQFSGLPPFSESTRRLNPAFAGGDPGPAADLERRPVDEPPATHGPQAFDRPVTVSVHCYRHRAADPDGTCAKWAIDALVHQGILRDDGPKYVREVRFRQTEIPRSEQERTEILIEEIS
jgi:hypothetical protein